MEFKGIYEKKLCQDDDTWDNKRRENSTEDREKTRYFGKGMQKRMLLPGVDFSIKKLILLLQNWKWGETTVQNFRVEAGKSKIKYTF